MENINKFYPHLSVDCVLLGFDGNDMRVLLIERTDTCDNEESNDHKLPGRLIYIDEDLDEAAYSVLNEYTGMDNPYLKQFKTFGSPDRTSNPKDVKWLENAVKQKIGRLITVAYMSMVRINEKKKVLKDNYSASWIALKDIPNLAFDHNKIIEEAISEIKRLVNSDPIVLAELLPPKFTALQLRKLYEQIYNKEIDVRNFQKKMKSMPFLVQLEERETNVAHRAARYYKFDKKKNY